VVLANTRPASLAEFDDEPSPLDRVNEDVAAGERVVAPSADKLDSASSGSLCENVSMHAFQNKDLGY
jgi:hypothetical protein